MVNKTFLLCIFYIFIATFEPDSRLTNMSLSVSNKESKHQESIESIFQVMKDFLSTNLDNIDKSQGYFNIGIEDELVTYLSQNLDNPLTIVAHSFDGHMASISQILEAITSKFFQENKKNIQGVFRSNEKGNFLHYYIVLKNDELKNRRVFFSFLREYEKEILSKQFPIFFEFISDKKEGLIRKAKEITLADERQPKKSKV